MGNMNDNEINMMAVQSNMRLNERFQMGGIKVAEKQAEASISASREVSVYLEKKFINERCKALKKGEYEEVTMDGEGKLIVIKKNALVDTGPGKVSNMEKPKLCVIRRANNIDECIYKISFVINGKDETLFLDPTKITDKAYITRKLSTKGVLLYGRNKNLIPEIFAYLVSANDECNNCVVPDCPGWFMTFKKKMGFAKKEDATWKTLTYLTR